MTEKVVAVYLGDAKSRERVSDTSKIRTLAIENLPGAELVHVTTDKDSGKMLVMAVGIGHFEIEKINGHLALAAKVEKVK